MHRLATSFVLGYHGCDRNIAEKLLAGEPFRPSENDYDWLGHGVYFWESSPERALDFVKSIKRSTEPAVVGAVIDLGQSLDMMSQEGIDLVRSAFHDLDRLATNDKVPLPKNSHGSDLLMRRLDCAVINYAHGLCMRLDIPPFQTVRGLFPEGEPLYENSGFRSKNHVQICVRDIAVIKGVFRVS